MISITPDTHIIESIRNQNVQPILLLFELIDNAFDAGATNISISLTRDGIVVQDNGSGCQDLSMMFTMGKRRSHTTTQLGRYGIGFKDAAIILGDVLTVTSTHRGIERNLMCDWRRIQQSGQWSINDPIARPTKNPPGTRISIEQLHHSGSYDKKKNETLINKIALNYIPALEEGKQILIQTNKSQLPTQVVPFQFPAVEQSLQQDLEIMGKRARVEIGLLQHGVKTDIRGLLVTYGFRLIEKNYHIGSSDEPTPGLVGRLTLMPEWQLTKNKDKVQGLDKLDQVIEERFETLIQGARARHQQFAMNSNIKQLNDMFTDVLAPVDSRAKRDGSSTKTGTVKPTGTGRPHRKAREVQPFGHLQNERLHVKGIKIAWDDTAPEDGPAHSYEAPGIIYLNANQPWLRQHLRDPEMFASFIVPVAATYIVLRHEGQLRFDFMDRAEDTAEKISHMTTYLLTRLLGNQTSEIPT